MNTCACTIVSANYLGYANSLMESLAKTNPEIDRKVLLVDKNDGRVDPKGFCFDLIEADSIGIPDFQEMSFRFGIMELNTNVKPFFLNHLLQLGYDASIYFDPDIVVFEPLADLQDLLRRHSIIITPHINTPITDHNRPNEQDHLLNGVFNLGFVAVSKCEEGVSFLNWWGKRCHELGFDDLRSGLFVDQKWIDYVPCFFPNHFILRDPGYNVAYWNLQERELRQLANGKWLVSDRPLVFFHFSGFPFDKIEMISRHQDRYTTEQYPVVKPLLLQYRQRLIDSNHLTFKPLKYAYENYLTGEKISVVARRYYSISQFQHNGENPFSEKSRFYQWAKRKRIHASSPSLSIDYNYRSLNKGDYKFRFLAKAYASLRYLLGADRYYLLMKFSGYFSVLRHQKPMF